MTLPVEEVRRIERLQKRFRIRTKVEVVRRGLRLLEESSERDLLRELYKSASQAVRDSSQEAIDTMDHLASEGLDED